MSIYKNYIIKSGDTIESIAQFYLKSSAFADKIISLNRLRYPYIAEKTDDKYGPYKASSPLLADWPKNSVSLNVSPYISSGMINSLVLSPKSLFYIRSNTVNGLHIEDTFIIDKYYSTTFGSIPAGTLLFSVPTVQSPVLSAEQNNMLFTTKSCVFSGTLTAIPSTSRSILNVTSILSGYIAKGMTISGINNNISATIVSSKTFDTYSDNVTGSGLEGTYVVDVSATNASQLSFVGNISSGLGPRSYYIQYSYIRNSAGHETFASPLYINSNTGAAIPFVVQSASFANSLLVVRAPDEWPEGATAVNIYAGSSISSIKYQTTLYSKSELFVESITGLSTSSSSIPAENTAYIGTSSFYNKGTQFFIYENPEQYGTQVLAHGDTLLLPVPSGQAVGSIISSKRTNKFYSSLGTDIALNAAGQIEFSNTESGDLQTITGVANVKQALLSRLSTKVNSFKTRQNFGNSAISMIGAKYSAAFLTNLKLELVSTLQKERRVYMVRDFDMNFSSQSSAIIIKNLAVEILHDGQSSSLITFDPIALPI